VFQGIPLLQFQQLFFDKAQQRYHNLVGLAGLPMNQKFVLLELQILSEIKIFTDKFFDNVIVNDDNSDIKNNRLELLKMFCNTFNNFINFSKLEGIS